MQAPSGSAVQAARGFFFFFFPSFFFPPLRKSLGELGVRCDPHQEEEEKLVSERGKERRERERRLSRAHEIGPLTRLAKMIEPECER